MCNIGTILVLLGIPINSKVATYKPSLSHTSIQILI